MVCLTERSRGQQVEMAKHGNQHARADLHKSPPKQRHECIEESIYRVESKISCTESISKSKRYPASLAATINIRILILSGVRALCVVGGTIALIRGIA